MNSDYACSLIESCTYKPSHYLYAHKLDQNTVELEVWAQGLIDSDAVNAPTYRKTINRADVFQFDVSTCSTPEQLWAMVMQALIDWETHEAREFFSVDSMYHKPFHPHTQQGQFNFNHLVDKVKVDKV